MAKALDKNESTITRWCQSGKMPAIAKPYGDKISYFIAPQSLELFRNQPKTPDKSRKNISPLESMIKPWVKAMAKGTLNGKVYSQRTIDDYRWYVDKFTKKQGSLTLETVKRELQGIPSNQFSKREHYYKALLCFARFLVSEGQLEPSLLESLKPLYPERHKPIKRHCLNETEIEALYLACESPLEKALLTLLTTTGLRASECCNLLKSDIDLSKHEAIVRLGKGGKSRTLGFNESLNQTINEYLATRQDASPYLFLNRDSKKMTPRGLHDRLARLGNRLGLTVHPHALRRAFVTINASKGRPLPILQKACGHSDIKTTMGYCRISEQEVIEAMKYWK